MDYTLSVLSMISALAVIIPGLFLLLMVRGVKMHRLRNLTVLLASFGLLHGLYHVLMFLNMSVLANPVDLLTVVLLVVLGIYYNRKAS